MFKGATGKRLCYFASASLRFLSFLGLLIAFVVVKIVNEPDIEWLNALLLILSITCLFTSLYNLGLCGMTASGYESSFTIQIVCFVITLFTGGIISSIFTGVAVFTKVDKSEIKNERIFNTKTFKKEGEKDDKKEK